MSKNETTGNSKDVFSVYQENVDKIFSGIKQSVPQYHQSVTKRTTGIFTSISKM